MHNSNGFKTSGTTLKNTVNKYALLFLRNYKQEIILGIIIYCTATCNRF